MAGGGTASMELPTGLRVAALTVVNAFGDVRDPRTGEILAGARVARESRRLADTAATMRRGTTHRGYSGENTTLAVVATNARLTKVQATKMAQLAQHGLVRTIVPVHTTLDGDLVVSLATGEVAAEPVDLNALGLAAADTVAESILRAIRKATTLAGIPAWQDSQKA
ncbi:MAG TPA: P1 family peptidase, partial [Candidatus Acidoferrum sp.]|nr:P1 family peptidase [Candidatus Acidoferrum sp.]